MELESEAKLRHRLQKDYAAKGYEVSAGARPKTAEGRVLRPDLTARKGEETVLIAFRAYGAAAEDEARIRELANAAQAEPGWTFRLFLVEGPEVRLPEPPPPRAISARIARARTLMREDDAPAALLTAWTAMEAAARNALEPDDRPAKLQAADALVKDLVSYGFLDQEAHTRFAGLARLRDRVAHGFFDQPIADEEVEALAALAESLLSENRASVQLAAKADRSKNRKGKSRRW